MSQDFHQRAALAAETTIRYVPRQHQHFSSNAEHWDSTRNRLGEAPADRRPRNLLSGWQRLQKSLLDRLISMTLLIAVAPAFAGIALLIRLDSKGPILFRQPRIGLNNQLFTCLKFRTMHHHMEDKLADRQTVRNDPRLTRIGQWLRRFSLDELPQLLNVLVGDMSIVGPRPHAQNTKAEGRLFVELIPDYASRHRLKPGITGWAQVNGWRGETSSAYQLKCRVEHDLYYIDNWSLRFDFYILALTTVRGFTGPQAF